MSSLLGPERVRFHALTWVRRARSTLLAAGAVALTTGCYTTRLVVSAPAAGETVLLDLNDRARVELGERIGPSAARIQGIVQTQDARAYVLHVSSVQYLNDRTNKWSGESLTIPVELVSRAQVRTFSRGRTSALGIGIAAALAAVISRTDFFGSAGPEKQPLPPPGGET